MYQQTQPDNPNMAPIWQRDNAPNEINRWNDDDDDNDNDRNYSLTRSTCIVTRRALTEIPKSETRPTGVQAGQAMAW